MARTWSDQTNKKADEVMAYIVDYKAIHDGVPPSIRDIMEELDLSSTSVARYYMSNLERRGKIEITPRVARGIRVLWSSRSLNVPT